MLFFSAYAHSLAHVVEFLVGSGILDAQQVRNRIGRWATSGSYFDGKVFLFSVDGVNDTIGNMLTGAGKP